MMTFEIEQLYREAQQVGKAIEFYGGSFAKGLLVAMQAADHKNLAKIKTTWPELWQQYLEMSQLMQMRLQENE